MPRSRPHRPAPPAFSGVLREALGEKLDDARLRAILRNARTSIAVKPMGDPAWRSVDAATIEALRTVAEREADTPWPQPLASHYARYFRDGNRTEYEDRLRALDRRLSRAVILAAATDETRWVDEAVDGIILSCELSSWSWAAHDDTFLVHGAVVPTVTAPYLDLGAGELAAQLAWASHVLAGALDDRAPGVSARIRHETTSRVFTPFLERRDWHWLGLDGDVHNWSPWIQGNIIAAALLLDLGEQQRAELVALALEGLDRYVSALPPDGSIDEGYSYWWNGAGRALEALSLLREASGGAIDATLVPVLAETARFPHRMQLGGDWYVNHADGSARPSGDQPWQVLHRWGVDTSDEEVRSHAASRRQPGPVTGVEGGLGRAVRALFDDDWARAVEHVAPLVASVWLPDGQVGLARQHEGSPAGLTLVVKGGHNAEHHNHNDVGSVIVASGGVPVVVDAGRPTYTAQTFGPHRYEIWTMQSAWHNVPAPRGQQQPAARSAAARLIGVHDREDEFSVELELSDAYGPDVLSWRRRATLDRQQAVVRVLDRWEFAPSRGAHPPTVVRFLLHGDVVLVGPGRAIVTGTGAQGDGKVLLSWSAGAATASLLPRQLDDPLLTQVWGASLVRLDLAVLPEGADDGELEVTVEEHR